MSRGGRSRQTKQLHDSLLYHLLCPSPGFCVLILFCTSSDGKKNTGRFNKLGSWTSQRHSAAEAAGRRKCSVNSNCSSGWALSFCLHPPSAPIRWCANKHATVELRLPARHRPAEAPSSGDNLDSACRYFSCLCWTPDQTVITPPVQLAPPALETSKVATWLVFLRVCWRPPEIQPSVAWPGEARKRDNPHAFDMDSD